MPDFGTDLSAFPDLGSKIVTQGDNLVEALMRRLMTPKGNLFYDLNYGTSLHDWIGEGIDDYGIGCAVTVESDLEDDPRVRSATCTIASVNLRGIVLEVFVETAAGPFELIVEASMAAPAVYPNVTVRERQDSFYPQ